MIGLLYHTFLFMAVGTTIISRAPISSNVTYVESTLLKDFIKNVKTYLIWDA